MSSHFYILEEVGMMKKAVRTYVTRFSVAMGIYAILLIASVLLIRATPGAMWNIPLAVLPVAPLIYGLLAFLHFFDYLDEMHKQIHLRALAFASAGTALLTFSYGLLENAGLPQLSWVWVFPLIIFLWGIGTALASRRYE
jgi:hypothetical protein